MKEPILYRIARGPLAVFLKTVYRSTVIGKENIPQDGSIILAGNHTNYFDCILIASATKRCVHYLAKDELMKPPLNLIFKNLGIIPVNRRQKDKAALESAEAVLKEGKVIGIFPEGTINRTDDVIMPFKFGAVKMAYETNTKIVPFVITGKYKPFKKSVKVRFFEAVSVSENLEEANNKLMKIVYDELVKEGEKNEKA
ncbi:MAG: 1-acyl-sn-glycerol-3-phosphate acyltransferase [Acutalibacteraceae bacterium]|nr:1-acyl-sn-glycerol-3-phosphate acyltransferase [Acutalibacteraceae bacterium]